MPSGFTASVAAEVLGRQPGTSAATDRRCTTPDKGAQQLTVTLTRSSDGQKDSLVIVKRDEVQP